MRPQDLYIEATHTRTETEEEKLQRQLELLTTERQRDKRTIRRLEDLADRQAQELLRLRRRPIPAAEVPAP